MVNSATEICDRVGHIMAYGDGWYGGVYVAAMYSLAYVSDDVEYVVTEALRSIPRESRFHACMADVINWHKQYPEDWKKCWEEIEKKWGSNDIACPDGVEMPFNIETYVNGAYISTGRVTLRRRLIFLHVPVRIQIVIRLLLGEFWEQ